MLQFLMECHLESPALLNWIIIGDKMWVHHHILELKKANKAKALEKPSTDICHFLFCYWCKQMGK